MEIRFLAINHVWEPYECQGVSYNDRKYLQGKLAMAVPKRGKNSEFQPQQIKCYLRITVHNEKHDDIQLTLLPLSEQRPARSLKTYYYSLLIPP
jgi:hypothetical protein